MTLPVTDFPAFASNANYATGPDAGTPTKVLPPAPADGFVPETAAVPQYVNYLFENIKQHITYLRNLAAEAITWTGVHAFTNTVAFGAAVFTTNEIAYPSPQTRRVMIPVTAFNADPASVWTFTPTLGAGAVWSSTATATPATLSGWANVPNGAIVTNVRVAVQGTNTVENGELRAYKVTNNRTTGAQTFTALGSATTFDYTGAVEVKNQTGAISSTFTEQDTLAIEILTGTLGAGALQFWWAEVEYTELRATGSN